MKACTIVGSEWPTSIVWRDQPVGNQLAEFEPGHGWRE